MMLSDPSPEALVELVRSRCAPPVSVYRLQLHKDFTFQDAQLIVPYLSRLGIDSVYCSPYLAARPGSEHGYDICDHTRLNPELGSDDDYRQFVDCLHQHGMKQLLDIVPNHMAADAVSNGWWRDVLERGPTSAFARYFDIDWYPLKGELRGKLLLPILGDHYGAVLERGEILLVCRDGEFLFEYGPINLPLNDQSLIDLLRVSTPSVNIAFRDEADVIELFDIVATCEQTLEEAKAATYPRNRATRDLARERLASLLARSERIRLHVESILEYFQGKVSIGESFDPLHSLLESQHYRLSYWKTAIHEINYRRFFDVNDLAGVRVEESEVFEATHSKILELLKEGSVSALRLDHVDGLFDPKAYMDRLQRAYLYALAQQAWQVAPDWLDAVLENQDALDEQSRELLRRPLVIYVEKILSANETVDPTWAMHGTTGYDYLNEVSGLFVDGPGYGAINAFYRRFTPQDAECQASLRNSMYECKKLIMSTSLAAELSVLADALDRISEQNRYSRDFTLDSLRSALSEMVACFPAYRTYLTETNVSEWDRQTIETALRGAARRNPAMEPSIFSFLKSILIPEEIGTSSKQRTDRSERVRFAMKLQQYTGPVQAKGVEDTVFYRQNALISVNEVGSNPDLRSVSAQQYHAFSAERCRLWPNSLVTTSTHDTKHGEDMRARLNALTEFSGEWEKQIEGWAEQHKTIVKDVGGEPAPSCNDQYLLYQTIVGIWPLEWCGDIPQPDEVRSLADRVIAYMQKATKEAKVHSSWINPSEPYHEAMRGFIEELFVGSHSQVFIPSLSRFVAQIGLPGILNSLSQVVLKLCAPGVPDVYQGSELWDFRLVDPDNRRAVDYAQREQVLDEVERRSNGEEGMSTFLTKPLCGGLKLAVFRAVLHLRRAAPMLFSHGSYDALESAGERAAQAVAFLRMYEADGVIALVPRLVGAQGNGLMPQSVHYWSDTAITFPETLSGRVAVNIFTGEKFEFLPAEGGNPHSVRVGELLKEFPVAVLRLVNQKA